MPYFVNIDNTVYGPYDDAVFQDYIREGRITRQSAVSTDGVNWQPAGTMPGLLSTAPPPFDMPPAAYPDQYQPNPHQPYGPVRARGGSGKATASVVLGIVGAVAWPVWPIGIPLMIIGIVLGIMGLRGEARGRAMLGLFLNAFWLLFTLALLAIVAYLIATGQMVICGETGQVIEMFGNPL